MKKDFAGTITTMVTPFDLDGKFDRRAMEFLLKQQHDADVNGVVILGNIGETPTIAYGERLTIVEACVSIVRSFGSMKVIAGTGSNSTEEAVNVTRAVKEIGVDAILNVESFNPGHSNTLRHCEQVKLAAGDLPVIWYIAPGDSGDRVEDRTHFEIIRKGYAQGIKWDSRDFRQLSSIANNRPDDDFAIYCGDDANTCNAMCRGACGVISIVSNLVPAQVVKVTSHMLTGEPLMAGTLHSWIMPLINALFLKGTPCPQTVKTALCMMYPDIVKKIFRSPLSELAPWYERHLEEILREHKLIP